MATSAGIRVTRLPDGCKQIGPGKLIRVRSPFDWILSFKGKTALLDTKTISGKTFPYSAIDDFQAHILYAHEMEGAIAGYVVEIRGENRIIFLKASQLMSKLGQRGSFKPEDGLDLGTDFTRLWTVAK